MFIRFLVRATFSSLNSLLYAFLLELISFRFGLVCACLNVHVNDIRASQMKSTIGRYHTSFF